MKYYSPTPKKWRKIGDALLAVSLFITSSAIATDNNIVAYIALGIGICGKFLTNLYSE